MLFRIAWQGRTGLLILPWATLPQLGPGRHPGARALLAGYDWPEQPPQPREGPLERSRALPAAAVLGRSAASGGLFPDQPAPELDRCQPRLGGRWAGPAGRARRGHGHQVPVIVGGLDYDHQMAEAGRAEQRELVRVKRHRAAR
jgi:hypothetical protein